MPQSITEKDGAHEKWYADAESVTEATLPEFVHHVVHDYAHDYGTICHAVAACALAAAHAVNHDKDQGGITGFQAGCLMWEFIRRWIHIDGPARLLQFKMMLYPQHADDFTTIEPRTRDWLVAEAKKQLESAGEMHPSVRAHMESVAAGKVPFGYTVKE